MVQQPLVGIPRVLWRLVATARHRLLMLDYDGTLAPFRVERGQARPLPGTSGRIAAIAASGRTTVAVISGRPVEELNALLGVGAVTLLGEHGWERQMPDGSRLRYPMSEATTAALDNAEQSARTAGWDLFLERKRTGVVLHTRGLPPAQAGAIIGACHDLWQAFCVPGNLRLSPIDGGLELRAAERDKGTATLSLISLAGPGTLPVYVGDDESDEDAFAVVRDFGFGLRVGSPDRDTQALGVLPGCEAVEAFLEEWLHVVEVAPGA